VVKGYDVWIPQNDRSKLDWALADRFVCRSELPRRYNSIESIVKEVDVIWLKKGSTELTALFEVEYSTPIYSGLLRFNDLYLTDPTAGFRFNIVSNDTRRAQFLRQIGRPTFQVSGLAGVCNFLEYTDVYNWFHRVIGRNS
jgi:type II restriction enzyme